MNSSPFASALGSWFASLHPGCVHAEIVTTKLRKQKNKFVIRYAPEEKERNHVRNEQTESEAGPSQNGTDACFLECTRESDELVIFFVCDWNEEHECREDDP